MLESHLLQKPCYGKVIPSLQTKARSYIDLCRWQMGMRYSTQHYLGTMTIPWRPWKRHCRRVRDKKVGKHERKILNKDSIKDDSYSIVKVLSLVHRTFDENTTTDFPNTFKIKTLVWGAFEKGWFNSSQKPPYYKFQFNLNKFDHVSPFLSVSIILQNYRGQHFLTKPDVLFLRNPLWKPGSLKLLIHSALR